jgi:hypothetical protein
MVLAGAVHAVLVVHIICCRSEHSRHGEDGMLLLADTFHAGPVVHIIYRRPERSRHGEHEKKDGCLGDASPRSVRSSQRDDRIK